VPEACTAAFVGKTIKTKRELSIANIQTGIRQPGRMISAALSRHDKPFEKKVKANFDKQTPEQAERDNP
jgi:hypothetical protein